MPWATQCDIYWYDILDWNLDEIYSRLWDLLILIYTICIVDGEVGHWGWVAGNNWLFNSLDYIMSYLTKRTMSAVFFWENMCHGPWHWLRTKMQICIPMHDFTYVSLSVSLSISYQYQECFSQFANFHDLF